MIAKQFQDRELESLTLMCLSAALYHAVEIAEADIVIVFNQERALELKNRFYTVRMGFPISELDSYIRTYANEE